MYFLGSMEMLNFVTESDAKISSRNMFSKNLKGLGSHRYELNM